MPSLYELQLEDPAWLLAADWVTRLGVAALIMVRSRGSPAVRLAWLVVVLAVPLLGAFFYLVVGEVRLGRFRIKRHRRVIARVHEVADRYPVPSLPLGPAGVYRKGAILIQALGGPPPRPGNLLRLYGRAPAAIEILIDDIDAASKSCHLLFYIYLDDGTGSEVAQALLRAASRGVACRLLVDGRGSVRFLHSSLCRKLRAGGVNVVAALPVNPVRGLLSRLDHRNHRKIAVIDGRIGWTGSQNIADEDFAVKAAYSPWIDVMVRIEGPAVADLQVIFAEDWLLDHDERPEDLLVESPPVFPEGVPVQIIGSGPCADTNAMRDLTLLAFMETDDRLVLTTPYFVPDEATTAALIAIAHSGVRTVLVVPKRNDSPLVAAASRSYYERLLRAGVEIYEFRPGLLHAKTFTFDREMSMVATANLDRRSYELNYEVSMVVVDDVFTSQLRHLQESYVAQSDRVRLEDWQRRGWTSRLRDNLVGLLAPLL